MTEAPRCVLAVEGEDGPFAASAPFWWDGTGLWLAGELVADLAARLRQRPAVSACVPPTDPDGPWVVVRGRARTHGLHDPIGLAVHAPAITAALGALALKVAPSLPALARDIPRIPVSRWPSGLVVVRLPIDRSEIRRPPPGSGKGMGPALPSVVPPPVRRAVSGRRDVVLALAADGAQHSGAPDLGPAFWSTGFRLETVDPLPEGAPATVVVDAGQVSLALEGVIQGGRLACRRARWRQGLVGEAADVPARAVGGIVLPD